MGSFKEFLWKYRALLTGAGIGLLLGILFLLIGFFPTILLVIMTGLGAAIGGIPGVRAGIAGLFTRLFTKLFHKN